MIERRAKNIVGFRRALFSECEKYRYLLEVVWDDSLSACMFIGLNPSTATEQANDPTLTRCQNFARDWGYGSLLMTNLFAARSTDPAIMKTWNDPVGPENTLEFLKECASRSYLVVAAWGEHGKHRGRDREIVKALPTLYCLKQSAKTGAPFHPLYLPALSKPLLYSGAHSGSRATANGND